MVKGKELSTRYRDNGHLQRRRSEPSQKTVYTLGRKYKKRRVRRCISRRKTSIAGCNHFPFPISSTKAEWVDADFRCLVLLSSPNVPLILFPVIVPPTVAPKQSLALPSTGLSPPIGVGVGVVIVGVVAPFIAIGVGVEELNKGFINMSESEPAPIPSPSKLLAAR